MALYLCKNADGTGLVSESNPLETKHTSAGEPVEIPVYIVNDGKREGVANDNNPPPLIYTNIQVRVEGVDYKLTKPLTPSTLDATAFFDSVDGWNIGTIIKSGLERMRVEELLTDKSVRVTRSYIGDGHSSTIQGHSIGALFVSESNFVSLALPSVADYEQAGTYAEGEPLTSGFDPSYLTNNMDANFTSTSVRTSNGALYSANSLIKIDNELMKITAISNNDLTVIRGFNGSERAPHSVNATIYCVGIVDVAPITHKFFIKNDPPSGLPTQKKKDIKIVIIADEEPQ